MGEKNENKKETKQKESNKKQTNKKQTNEKGSEVVGTKLEHWKSEPDPHDYPAAVDYLTLLMPPADAETIVGRLELAPLSHRKAKDLLRASALPLLGPDNAHVAKDLAKVNAGEKLSPVLLVRGQLNEGAPLTIADGYHRVCASYHLDEDADIPSHIVDLGL